MIDKDYRQIEKMIVDISIKTADAIEMTQQSKAVLLGFEKKVAEIQLALEELYIALGS